MIGKQKLNVNPAITGKGSSATYDRTSHIGKLYKGLDEAAAKGWTVVDMKKDWKTIFPPAKK